LAQVFGSASVVARLAHAEQGSPRNA